MHMVNVEFVIAVVVIIGCTRATSTDPFVSKTRHLPWLYLVPGDGSATAGVHPLAAAAPVAAVTSDASVAWAARAQYNASAWDIGWDWLRVQASPDLIDTPPGSFNRAWGYYYAGYLEAFLTQRVITPVASTSAWESLPVPVAAWISEHIAFMNSTALKNHHASDNDPFWRQVGDLLSQIRGLTDGYNAAVGDGGGGNMTFENMFLASFGVEVGDVMAAVPSGSSSGGNDDTTPSLRESLRRRRGRPLVNTQSGSGHCTGFVKPTATDLFVAHDTWGDYTLMAHRMFKRYDFQISVSMSSYPASIASMDDWYMTSNELAVQETSDSIFNMSLYVAVVPATVSEFLRVMSANYLADGGDAWTAIFATLNSGTYNNQYMVVDFKLYTPSPAMHVADGTLWVAEQVPGLIERGDVSSVLRAQGYWASYNIPYFPRIYDISGYAQVEAQQGTFWSYTKYARPMIFRRNHTDVADLPSAMRLMRYNNWVNDALSDIPNCTGTPNGECSPQRSSMLSIASRGDLMTVYNTTAQNIEHYGPLYASLAPGCFGAIDSKIARWSDRKSLTGFATNGPTNDQQPVFVWNTGACTGTPAPAGAPTVVNFPWVMFESA